MSCASRRFFSSLGSAMAVLAIAPETAPAQAARPTATTARPTAVVLREVDGLLARNDSLRALDVLDSALARDRKNGTLWNRYGLIAWGISKREQGPFMRPEMIRLRMRSDSAFRYATAFAPDSAEYFLDLGRYALETNILTVRQGAKGNFEDGIKVAQKQGRQELSSSMIDGLGMFHWRDYDNNNHRAVVKSPEVIGATQTPVGPTTTATAPGVDRTGVPVATPSIAYRDDYGAYYRDRLSPVTPVTGESEYIRARQNFTDAVAANGSNAKARQHLYMALAEKQAWQDLLRESDRALRLNGDDINAWLARGLASSSLQDYENAASAFDQGLRRMPAPERAAFSDIRRLLPPQSTGVSKRFADTLAWRGLSEGERRRQEVLFWNLADPRSNTRVNEAMLEYYSRVAYSDLRFGSDEYRIRGSDSDRGIVWIRYGPPSEIFSVPLEGKTNIIWIYDRPNLAFVFEMRPTFATAHFPFGENSKDSIMTETPVAWGNLPLARRTWPMRMRAARFRSSSKDSMDVVVTATVPVRSFLEGAELNGALPISVQLDVHDPASRIVGREVRNVTVRMDSLPVGINGAWVRRLGRGANVVRVDAEQLDVNRGASNAVDAAVDTTSGFGMSDLLLGTNPKRVGNADPKRWNDISIAPNTGAFPYSQSLGVVWEIYDLVAADGNVKYKVNLHLQRTVAGTFKGFMAKVAAYTKNVLERNSTGTGTVQVSYDQLRPASPVIADYMSVNLDGAVTGTYRLEIEIVDLVTGKVTKRSVPFDLTKD